MILIFFFAILCIFGYWILQVLQTKGMKRIADRKVSKTTKNLKRIVKDEYKFINIETYQKWLDNSNPEQLYIRILANTASNQKLFRKNTRKLLLACDAIDWLIHMDDSIKAILNVNTREGVKFLEEMKDEIKNRVVFVEQSFSDIKNELEIL